MITRCILGGMAILKLLVTVLLLPFRAVVLLVHLVDEAHAETVAALPLDE